ncbi:MAG: type VI secretion system tube protein Hcp [Syntrophobacteraceae bacterium]|nr:type VI secretion system tube protein Hcp [Syntrophobacteraceae bacterium]
MAVSIFLKFEGPNVEGESVVEEHQKEIDVSAWSWGMTQSGSMHVATGGGSGKVSVQDITITKQVDKATPVLMKYCCSGQHFNKATLTVTKAGGDKPVPYLTINMENVLISSQKTGGSNGGETISESVSLNFGKYKVLYKPQSKEGIAMPEVEHAWDIAMNKTF